MEDLGNIKLIPAHKVEWLEALRSGEYTQGRSCLRDDMEGAKFCCLGVACDVYKGSHPNSHWEPTPNFSTIKRFHDGLGEENEIFLPTDVFKWFFGYECEEKFDSSVQINMDAEDRAVFIDRYLKKNKHHSVSDSPTVSLTCMNDIGYSFKEIADIIEKYL